ncbi:DNA polymerase V subunit UmuC [Salmonella enterica subsp. enterica serovar Montevideo str. IA_2010008282]|nr:DNA polymerase V subunit UmuC [Salmonella enterica subsp. enterica serovar Montevideo str. IA_2010008282]
MLERTVRELRGEPCLELEEFAPAKQEIVCSRSFGERVTDYEEMRQAIYSYAARAAEKLPRRAPVLPFHLNIRQNIPLCPERALLR